jgi:hypothetical protein
MRISTAATASIVADLIVASDLVAAAGAAEARRLRPLCGFSADECHRVQLWRAPVEPSGGPIGPSEPHEAHGMMRIELERLAEQHPCLAIIVLGEMPEQHAFPDIEILGALMLDAGLFAFDEAHP